MSGQENTQNEKESFDAARNGALTDLVALHASGRLYLGTFVSPHKTVLELAAFNGQKDAVIFLMSLPYFAGDPKWVERARIAANDELDIALPEEQERVEKKRQVLHYLRTSFSSWLKKKINLQKQKLI